MRKPGDKEVSIAVYGSCSSGKTSFLNCLINNTFNEHYKKTINVERINKSIKINDAHTLKITFWDCSGDANSYAISKSYQKNAQFILLCIDLSNQRSFNQAEDLLNSNQFTVPRDKIILTGLKADLGTTASREQFETFARNNNLRHMSVSAKSSYDSQEPSLERALLWAISPDPLSEHLKNKINTYKTDREQNNREYTNFFRLGYSKRQKIAAARALIDYLNSPTATSIDTRHIKALKDGSLGKMIRAALRDCHIIPATLEGLITHFNHKQKISPPAATAASAKI